VKWGLVSGSNLISSLRTHLTPAESCIKIEHSWNSLSFKAISASQVALKKMLQSSSMSVTLLTTPQLNQKTKKAAYSSSLNMDSITPHSQSIVPSSERLLPISFTIKLKTDTSVMGMEAYSKHLS